MQCLVGLILSHAIMVLEHHNTNTMQNFSYLVGQTVVSRNSVFPVVHYLSNDSLSNVDTKKFFGYKEINISKQNVKEFSTYSEA